MRYIKSSLLISFFLILLYKPGYSQKDSLSSKIVYLELFGSGDIYTVNFEQMFKQKHSLQVGISWLPGTWQLTSENDRSFIYVPVVYHYLYGKHNHKIDFSAGIIHSITWYNASANNYKFKPEAGISYRYQRRKGLFCKAGFMIKVPLSLSADVNERFFYTERHWLLWPSVGAGWSF